MPCTEHELNRRGRRSGRPRPPMRISVHVEEESFKQRLRADIRANIKPGCAALAPSIVAAC